MADENNDTSTPDSQESSPTLSGLELPGSAPSTGDAAVVESQSEHRADDSPIDSDA